MVVSGRGVCGVMWYRYLALGMMGRIYKRLLRNDVIGDGLEKFVVLGIRVNPDRVPHEVQILLHRAQADVQLTCSVLVRVAAFL